MNKILFISIFITVYSLAFGESMPYVKFVDRDLGKERLSSVRIAQFQIEIPYDVDSATYLPLIKGGAKYFEKIDRCLDSAAKKGADIVVFPELAVALDSANREKIIKKFRKFAQKNDAAIIAGTYYNKERQGCCPVIFPDTVYTSYKIRPSIFESSVYAGKGMKGVDTLCVYRTKYGKLSPLICVDLISDDANYTVRRLSNRGEIDILFSICYNPASREFLREASSLVTRHPLFVVISNVSNCPGGESERKSDTAYGYSGILGSLQHMQRKTTLLSIPEELKNRTGNMHDSYENTIAVIEPFTEAGIIYDINLSVIRVPANTNAPDQGYPTVKEIEYIPLSAVSNREYNHRE